MVFTELPAVYVVYNSKFYYFKGNKQAFDHFLHFLNRVIEPVVPLKTDSDVEEFFNIS
jgi:hypothetical protein